jgi:hypothetical protein
VIIKTALNAHAGNLHRHLTRRDDGNEKIRVVEVRGCVADEENLLAALREMKATAAGTRCEKSLYHASFAAPKGDMSRLQSDAAWLRCADRLEQEFGLENHARAVVHHFKDGRWHQHVVWNRIDPETGKAAHLSHERRRAIKVARELERELDLTPVSSRRPEHRKEQRPPLQWEHEAARRTKRVDDSARARDQISASWGTTSSGAEFRDVLDAQNLILAKGDRRAFVICDEAGNYYALGARLLPGEKAKSIADRLSDVRDQLPTLDQARELQKERALEKEQRRGKSGEGEKNFDLERKRARAGLTPEEKAGRARDQRREGAAQVAKDRGPAAIANALMRDTTEAQAGQQQAEQAKKDDARKLDEERQKQAEISAAQAWRRQRQAELRAQRQAREQQQNEKDPGRLRKPPGPGESE